VRTIPTKHGRVVIRTFEIKVHGEAINFGRPRSESIGLEWDLQLSIECDLVSNMASWQCLRFT
jgi:hypothetical protein